MINPSQNDSISSAKTTDYKMINTLRTCFILNPYLPTEYINNPETKDKEMCQRRQNSGNILENTGN
jgi:hypothetical protein